MIERSAQVGMSWLFKIYFTHFLSSTDYESNVLWQGYDENVEEYVLTGNPLSTLHLI
jgi:hypothetical protein